MGSLDSLVGVLSSFSSIAVSLGAILALLSTIFKPIRNVLSKIFNRLTDRKAKDEALMNRIDGIETTFTNKMGELEDRLNIQIQNISDRNDENEKDRIRWEILDFANSCRNGRRHTKDEYEHIFRMNDKYHKMLGKEETNSYFEAEYEYIKHLFAERQEKNDFL